MRILFAVVATMMLFLVSACSGEDGSDSGTAPSGAVADEAFLSVVHSMNPGLSHHADSEMIELAHTICESFDAGLTFMDVVTAALNANLDPDVAGSIVGAGVEAYCPEHGDKLP